MSKKIVIANWKMNPLSVKAALKLFGSVSRSLAKIKNTKVVICPPFIYLQNVKKFTRKALLGAQDAYFGEVGAFTGEVSSEMLYDIGVRYVILGHSERRAEGEDNTLINKKLKAALASSIIPILCIGENIRDEKHEYFSIVQSQVTECLKNIPKNMIPKIIVAYEPVWALSTTKNRRDASPKDCEEMVIFIRKTIATLFSREVAGKIKILYGGSVTPRDTEDFLKEGGVDGLLVGRASLDAKKFSQIISIAENI
ncbi:MAG: triose-phosphate isomerase [Candidatus Paceibacterota bacterium]